MKNTFLMLSLSLTACGPIAMPNMAADDALPPIDESVCSRDQLEPDAHDSAELAPLPPGPWVVSTTYLRLPLTKSALAKFRELNQPMEDALRTNPGLIQAITRTSGACNTARTFAVWKDEASMYAFVTSEAHGNAMANVAKVSRGGSIVTHWKATTPEEVSWAVATQKLAAHTGPTY
jgi:hypothetical protein